MQTKVLIVKATIFLVVLYGYASWTIKKAEQPRMDASKLVLKTLESPLYSKEIKSVSLKGDQT